MADLYEFLYCFGCKKHAVMVKRRAPKTTVAECKNCGVKRTIESIRGAMRLHGFQAKRYGAMVDDDLVRIIVQALADAREKGLDDVGQTGHAVRAVLTARPDITASAALRAVNTWRRA